MFKLNGKSASRNFKLLSYQKSRHCKLEVEFEKLLKVRCAQGKPEKRRSKDDIHPPEVEGHQLVTLSVHQIKLDTIAYSFMYL